MSIVCCNENGWVISHLDFLKSLYTSDHGKRINETMFEINTPYLKDDQALKMVSATELGVDIGKPAVKKRKKSSTCIDVPPEYSSQMAEIQHMQSSFPLLISKARDFNNFLFVATEQDIRLNNQSCRKFAAHVYQKSMLGGESSSFFGRNPSDETTTAVIEDSQYIFPPKCSFYCKDVALLCRDAIHDCPNRGFDLVVIDPPWWNKYIRRRKACDQQSGYSMLRTEDLIQMNIKSLLAPGALVAVWCTNSQSHIQAVHDSLFPAWGVRYVATWLWLKVDRSGTPICNFSTPPGKQPYERIMFGRSFHTNDEDTSEHLPDPGEGKILISVPSGIHSHKPPLTEVLRPYVSQSPHQLEVFARSLLPDTVSWGLEVLKLQHECLFVDTASSCEPSSSA